MVPSGAAVCDVGTDHGLLPSYLYLRGDVKSVCATDINSAPLERAKDCIKRHRADGVRLILCDGLSGIEGSDADTVIIAGMGGEVISGIIERAAFLRDKTKTLILQPMTGADELRRYLYQNGFNIMTEPCVCEHGKVWSIMLVRFDGCVKRLDPMTALIGRVTPQTAEGRAYIQKQYDRCLKCSKDLWTVREQNPRYRYWFDLSEKLKEILEDYDGL